MGLAMVQLREARLGRKTKSRPDSDRRYRAFTRANSPATITRTITTASKISTGESLPEIGGCSPAR